MHLKKRFYNLGTGQSRHIKRMGGSAYDKYNYDSW